MARRPRVLTIAGSDSGGGAGIQADLKTFCAHGVYGACVLTAVTAQNTIGVLDVQLLDPRLVDRQLEAVLGDIGVDAVKIGMLGNDEIVRTVARRLEGLRDTPIVLDPVMVAKSGDSLLATSAVETIRSSLLPLATVVTPNIPEATILSGAEDPTVAEPEAMAREIAMAGPAVLLKGGHGEGDVIEDLLFADGRMRRYHHQRQPTRSTHGTGCTLSAAVASRLGRGERLEVAVEGAITYLQEAIRQAPGIGEGHGPVDHLHGLETH
jgi:hydroxymethylpyrimidine/phosphomethylpyrimidine kinase